MTITTLERKPEKPGVVFLQIQTRWHTPDEEPLHQKWNEAINSLTNRDESQHVKEWHNIAYQMSRD